MSAESSSADPAKVDGIAATTAVAAASAAVATTESKPFEIIYPPVSSAAQAAGRVTLVGFGSLLSQRSCSYTFPTLYNFRVGVIRGWRRIFAHVAPIFIERGIANVETREMSSLSVEPSPDPSHTLLVSVFEIPISDLPAFYSRELEFRWLYTPVYSPAPASASSTFPDNSILALDGRSIDGRGLICAAYTDEEYKRDRLNNSREAYQQAFGRWGIEQIWRNDLFPCPVYLRHVVLAAAGMDQAFRLQYPEKQCLVWKRESESKPENRTSEKASSESTPVAPAPAQSSSSNIVTPTFVSLPAGEVLDSFLDHTYLGDRVTSIRQYLNSKRGAEIMTTLPPAEFSTRYNG